MPTTASCLIDSAFSLPDNPVNQRQRIAAALEAADVSHLRRRRQSLQSPQGTRVQIDGRELLNFCSNDYLGYAKRAEIIEAVAQGARRWGSGSGASHLVCGHQHPTDQLEERFADFVGAEAALMFSTGYMANLAILQAFSERGGLILEDKLNHASLIDGAQLSRAQLKRYRHADATHLQSLLRAAGEPPSLMIATDTVFSMDGDMAPLQDIADAAIASDALCLFDDAHGFGVLGSQGRGSLQDAGIALGGNQLMLATLGKSMGNFGALVAGDRLLIDSLIQRARPYIYTTALPPAVVCGSLAALELLQCGDSAPQNLQLRIDEFRQRAEDLQLNFMASHSAIQPLIVGDNQLALSCAAALRERGILASAIRPPTVPEGTARIRFTLSAAHTSLDLDQLFNALKTLQKSGLLPA